MKCTLIYGFILLFSNLAYCQIEKNSSKKKGKKDFILQGEAGYYGDFYKMVSDTVGAVSPRRPSTIVRIVANITFKYKNISLPVTLSIPSKQVSVLFPSPDPYTKIPSNMGIPDFSYTPLEKLKLLIKNPVNRVGIAPKYKWCEVLLGSQVPMYSELSVGDLAIFGAGFNLNPKKLRLSFFSGTSQLAMEQDTNSGFPGFYARKIQMAKFGLGHEDSSHFYFIGAKLTDDTSSLIFKPASLLPQSGTLLSIDFRVNIGKKLYIKGEIAMSAFTRNTSSQELSDFGFSIPKWIFTPLESSRADFATILSVGRQGKNFGIKTTGRYYGDGYVSLGYPFLQTDRFDVTIDPSFNLLKNKLQLSGTIGHRVNNLSGIRATTTTQIIGSANLNIQFNDKWALTSDYSNFGFRNSIVKDTFKVEMVTVSWNVSSSYSYTTNKHLQNFSLSFGQNSFKDFNIISGDINNNDAQTGSFNYILSMLKTPLTVGINFNFLDNNASFGRLVTNSLSSTAGYKFFKKKLLTNIGLTFAKSKLNHSKSGTQIMGKLALNYSLIKKLMFSVTGTVNLFEFGVSRPGISYREDILRTSISYKI